MELNLMFQVYQAATSLLVGLGAGLYYDLLKTIRRRVGRGGATLLLDLLFWLGLAPLLFVQTMTMGQGGVRIFMLVTNALGALLYFLVFSRGILFLLEKGLDKMLKIVWFITSPARKIWAKGKNVAKCCKRGFKNWIWHCIITKYMKVKKFGIEKREGEDRLEQQKGKHIYEAGGVGLGRLRGLQSGRPPRSNRERKRG